MVGSVAALNLRQRILNIDTAVPALLLQRPSLTALDLLLAAAPSFCSTTVALRGVVPEQNAILSAPEAPAAVSTAVGCCIGATTAGMLKTWFLSAAALPSISIRASSSVGTLPEWLSGERETAEGDETAAGRHERDEEEADAEQYPSVFLEAIYAAGL